MKNPTLTFRRVRGRVIPVHVDSKGMGTPLTAAKKASYLQAQKTLKYKAIEKANSFASKASKLTLLQAGTIGVMGAAGAASLIKYAKNKKKNQTGV
jgi:hypothetical protein